MFNQSALCAGRIVSSTVANSSSVSPHIRLAAIKALGAVADAMAITRLRQVQAHDDASVPAEEPQSLAGLHIMGMRLVALRTAPAEALGRIRERMRQA